MNAAAASALATWPTMARLTIASCIEGTNQASAKAAATAATKMPAGIRRLMGLLPLRSLAAVADFSDAAGPAARRFGAAPAPSATIPKATFPTSRLRHLTLWGRGRINSKYAHRPRHIRHADGLVPGVVAGGGNGCSCPLRLIRFRRTPIAARWTRIAASNPRATATRTLPAHSSAPVLRQSRSRPLKRPRFPMLRQN